MRFFYFLDMVFHSYGSYHDVPILDVPCVVSTLNAGLRVVCVKKCATTTACWWPWRNPGELTLKKVVTLRISSKSVGYNMI